jgi:hypothetical protein
MSVEPRKEQSKEAKLEEIQKKIDELIKERERIKTDAI